MQLIVGISPPAVPAVAVAAVPVSDMWTSSKADCDFKFYSAADCCIFSVFSFLVSERCACG